jgi:hypothetical protein
VGSLEGRTDRSGRESLGLIRLESVAGLLTKVWMDLMGEILDAFIEAFDTDRPDIIDRLHHAQPLARGPYRRLINDSIIEIERLRAQLTQQGNPVNHNPDTKQHSQ